MCTDSCWLLCIFSLCRQATPSQVYFMGDVKGETAIKTESDIGSAITHHFRVSTGSQLDRSFIFLNLSLIQQFCVLNGASKNIST